MANAYPQSQLSMSQNTQNYGQTWGPNVSQPVSYLNQAPQPVSYLNQAPQYSMPQGQALGASTGSGGGSTAPASGDSNPKPTYDTGGSNSLIDEAAEAVYSFLNGAGSRIQEGLDSSYQDAESDFGVNKQIVDTSKQQSEQAVNDSAIEAEQRRQAAEDNSRNLYNQLYQGGVQRFGGASSAGQGYGELLGVEQQRQAGQINMDYGTAKRTIETAKQKIITDYNNSLLQLESIKQKAKNEAKRYFDDKMMEIDRMRAETGANKAQQKLAELQNLRNNMFNIDAAVYQMKAQVEAQKSAYDNQINTFSTALDSSTGTASTAASGMSTQYGSDLTGGQQSGVYDPTTVSYMGQTGKKKQQL